VITALKRNSLSFLWFWTDVVQDIYPGALLDRQHQQLIFLHVERPRTLDI